MLRGLWVTDVLRSNSLWCLRFSEGWAVKSLPASCSPKNYFSLYVRATEPGEKKKRENRLQSTQIIAHNYYTRLWIQVNASVYELKIEVFHLRSTSEGE